MARLTFLALALFQAQNDPLQDRARTIDAAIRGIPGYDAGREAKAVEDDVFLARLTRDLVDADPSEAEKAAFLAEPVPARRASAIDRLVQDERFDRFWAGRITKVLFGEFVDQRLEFSDPVPPGTGAAMTRAFESWLAAKLRKDTPWTDIVSEVLTARGTTEANPALGYLLSFYRVKGATVEFPAGVAKHFLGIRLYCAECHDHPYDKWRVEDYYGLGAFIARQKVRAIPGGLELKYAAVGELAMPSFDERKGSEVKLARGGEVRPNFLFGGSADQNDDRMDVLAKFITSRPTSQLPRALANRVWGWLFGYGIVHPVDDFNLRNKALSQALLEMLTRELVDNRYSLKHLVRLISRTGAYQAPMPAEAPNAASFRHSAQLRWGLGPFRPPNGKPVSVALSFAPPASWVPVVPVWGNSGARVAYRVPDRKDPDRFGVVLYIDGRKNPDFFQFGSFQRPKKETSVLEGKLKLSVFELSGVSQCKPGAGGPVDTVVLVVAAETTDGKGGTFKFEGPAALVNDRREEFLSMVKAATAK